MRAGHVAIASIPNTYIAHGAARKTDFSALKILKQPMARTASVPLQKRTALRSTLQSTKSCLRILQEQAGSFPSGSRQNLSFSATARCAAKIACHDNNRSFHCGLPVILFCGYALKYIHMDHHRDPYTSAHYFLAISYVSFWTTIFCVRIVELISLAYDRFPAIIIDQTHIHHFITGFILLFMVLLLETFLEVNSAVKAIIFGLGLALISDEFLYWTLGRFNYWSYANCVGTILISIILLAAIYYTFSNSSLADTYDTDIRRPRTSKLIPLYIDNHFIESGSKKRGRYNYLYPAIPALVLIVIFAFHVSAVRESQEHSTVGMKYSAFTAEFGFRRAEFRLKNIDRI
jgi:hypothetical protein